jgi:sulfate adenylyltransferase subunit 2
MPVAEGETNLTSIPAISSGPDRPSKPGRLSHLRILEAESVHILREVASEFERPVMLYSIGRIPR